MWCCGNDVAASKCKTFKIRNLNQNNQGVKKCGPQKGHGEKRCQIQGGGQEMAVMVRRLMAEILITTIQVNLLASSKFH